MKFVSSHTSKLDLCNGAHLAFVRGSRYFPSSAPSLGLEQQDGNMAKVEVYEMLRFWQINIRIYAYNSSLLGQDSP